jgi:hypothetical protein
MIPGVFFLMILCAPLVLVLNSKPKAKQPKAKPPKDVEFFRVVQVKPQTVGDDT